MEIDLPQDIFRAKEVTFAHDLSSEDEEEELKWDPQDTLPTLKA